MRRAAVVLVALSGTARADDRIAQPLIPELAILEPIYHLDRYEEHGDRGMEGAHGTFGVAAGTDVETLLGAALGWRDKEHLLVAMRGELATTNRDILRGHYRATAGAQDEHLGLAIDATGGVAVGNGELLAPAPLLGGRRTAADAATDAAFRIGRHRGDFDWVGEVHADGGLVYWDAGPIDHSEHRALGFGVGSKTFDGEIPRGTIDLTRARVEQVLIHPSVIAAGAAIPDATVRIVELGAGTTSLTLHIDRELLAVIATDIGWSWLESEHEGMRATNDAFRMRLGTAIEGLDGDHEVSRLGVAIGRIPTYTADGRLASEWRHELELGRAFGRWSWRMHGAISWLTPLEGSARPTTTRYAGQHEVYVRVIDHVEVGGYHATAYEPGWHTEAGVVVRAVY